MYLGIFCWKLAGYFIWPFGKYVHKVSVVIASYCKGN